MAGEPKRRPAWRALLALAALGALLKLILIVAPPIDTYPTGEGRAIAGEELLRGSATRDFIRGSLLPFQDYQVQPFWGGTLVVSVVAVPFFLALGPTIVALRLSAIVFGTLTIVFQFLILDRFVSRRAAWIGSLLIAMPPAGYAVFGAQAYGAEVENNTFALILTYAFLVLHYRRKTALQGALVGLSAGFAIYCGYIVLPLCALLALFTFLFDKRFWLRRDFLWQLGGLVVGLLPAVNYNLNHRGKGLAVYGKPLTGHIHLSDVHLRFFGALEELAWVDMPLSFHFPASLGGIVLGRVCLLVLAVFAAIAAWLHRDSLARSARALFQSRVEPSTIHPAAIFLAFLPAYLLAYIVSDFRIVELREYAIAYRYFLPLYPFLFMLTAIVLDHYADRLRIGRALAVAVPGALCALFTAASLLRADYGRIEANWKTPGYSDVQLARSIAMRYQGNTAPLAGIVERIVERRPSDEADLLLFVTAQTYKFHLHPGTTLDEALDAQRGEFARGLAYLHGVVPEPYKPYFEELAPGERIYTANEREAFWKDRERRRQGSSDG